MDSTALLKLSITRFHHLHHLDQLHNLDATGEWNEELLWRNTSKFLNTHLSAWTGHHSITNWQESSYLTKVDVDDVCMMLMRFGFLLWRILFFKMQVSLFSRNWGYLFDYACILFSINTSIQVVWKVEILTIWYAPVNSEQRAKVWSKQQIDWYAFHCCHWHSKTI